MTARPENLRARLHFIELGSPEPERLARFYGDIFDAPIAREGDSFVLRDSERALVFRPGEAKTLLGAGYRVEDEAALAPLAGRLEAGGASVERLAPSSLYEPGAIGFRDPDGTWLQYGVATAPAAPRVGLPGRLQHVVLGSRNAASMIDFHNNIVGLRLSDRVVDDQGGLRTGFLRTDDEHHSFAVFQTSSDRLDHHAYETTGWGDLRDWGDRLAARQVRVEWGPGRHGPGNNLFLFFYDPDGNFIEISAELEVVPQGKPTGEWPHAERTLNSWGRGFLRT
jgi:catechol 2,3-dioxygenase